MHVALVKVNRENLHIATTTVNLLLMLHGELDDQALSFIVKGRKLCRHGIEAGILAGLDTW